MFELIFVGSLFLILLTCTLVGFFRGFIKSIAGLIEYFVSFFIAYTFASPVSRLFKKLPFIANMITDVEMPEIDINEGFGSILLNMVKYITQSGINSSTAENVKQIANNYLADLLSIAMAFVSLFVLSILIQKLIVLIIDKFAKIEGIKQLNRGLGLVFGLFMGFMITWIIAILFTRFVLPILAVNYPETISESMADSFFMRLFTVYNPISLLMNSLLKL